MALRAALRRAVPVATIVQIFLVTLEESGLSEDLPAEAARMNLVEEQILISGERTACHQLIHVLQTKTSSQEAHPTVPVTHAPGII